MLGYCLSRFVFLLLYPENGVDNRMGIKGACEDLSRLTYAQYLATWPGIQPVLKKKWCLGQAQWSCKGRCCSRTRTSRVRVPAEILPKLLPPQLSADVTACHPEARPHWTARLLASACSGVPAGGMSQWRGGWEISLSVSLSFYYSQNQ